MPKFLVIILGAAVCVPGLCAQLQNKAAYTFHLKTKSEAVFNCGKAAVLKQGNASWRLNMVVNENGEVTSHEFFAAFGASLGEQHAQLLLGRLQECDKNASSEVDLTKGTSE